MKIYLFFVFLILTQLGSNAQWTKLNSPEGCTSSGFVRTSLGILLGTYGGLYLSTDEAATWQLASILQNEHISSIVAYADTIVIAYAPTTDRVPYYDSYITTSFDGGLTWTNADTLFNIMDVDLHIHGHSLYADTGDKLFYSSDFGFSWSLVNMPSGTFSGTSFYKDYFFVYTYNGSGTNMFVSPLDSMQLTPFNSNNITVMIDSIIFTSQSSVTPGYYDIIRSNDLGQTWNPVITIDSVLNFKLLVYNDSLFYNDPLDNFFVSADLGATWNPTHSPYQYNTYYLTLPILNGEILAVHYSGELYHYVIANDSSYLSRNGIYESSGTLYNSDSIIYFPTRTGFFRSIDDALSWQLMNSNPSSYLSNDLLIYGDTLYGVNSFLYSCYDGGQTWNFLGGPLVFDPLNYICRKNNRLIVAAWGQYYYSDDFGVTWNPITTLPQNSTTCGTNSGGIGNLATLSGHVYSSSIDGFVYELDSTDQNWIYKYCSIGGIGSAFPFKILTAGNCLLVSSYDALSVSADSGQTWIGSSMIGLPIDGAGRKVCPNSIIQSGNDLIGYCNGFGIYASSDYGISWYRLIQGPMPFYPTSLIIHNNQLFASGAAQGIWSTNVILNSPIISNQRVNAINVYPNPTQDQFQIELKEIPKDNVSLSLYNNIGVLIKEIKITSNITAISTNELPKGIYIGKVISNNNSIEGVIRIVII